MENKLIYLRGYRIRLDRVLLALLVLVMIIVSMSVVVGVVVSKKGEKEVVVTAEDMSIKAKNRLNKESFKLLGTSNGVSVYRKNDLLNSRVYVYGDEKRDVYVETKVKDVSELSGILSKITSNDETIETLGYLVRYDREVLNMFYLLVLIVMIVALVIV